MGIGGLTDDYNSPPAQAGWFFRLRDAMRGVWVPRSAATGIPLDLGADLGSTAYRWRTVHVDNIASGSRTFSTDELGFSGKWAGGMPLTRPNDAGDYSVGLDFDQFNKIDLRTGSQSGYGLSSVRGARTVPLRLVARTAAQFQSDVEMIPNDVLRYLTLLVVAEYSNGHGVPGLAYKGNDNLRVIGGAQKRHNILARDYRLNIVESFGYYSFANGSADWPRTAVRSLSGTNGIAATGASSFLEGATAGIEMECVVPQDADSEIFKVGIFYGWTDQAFLDPNGVYVNNMNAFGGSQVGSEVNAAMAHCDAYWL